jgi:hypothetical protein
LSQRREQATPARVEVDHRPDEVPDRVAEGPRRRRDLDRGRRAGKIGQVKDESGGVLPGVDITVTQTATGATRTAVSDTDGAYTLTNLPIGPYRLEATLQGFRSYVQTGIVLQVNANPTVNVVMVGRSRSFSTSTRPGCGSVTAARIVSLRPNA